MSQGFRQIAVLFVGVALATAAGPASSQPSSGEERARAKEVLDRALDVLGGKEKLQNLISISISGRGIENLSGEVQGLHPEKPTERPHEEFLAVNLRENKTAYERHTPRNDQTIRWRRTILTGDQEIFADRITKSARTSHNQNAQADGESFRRRIPHLLLLEAARRAAELRWLGEVDYGGKPHQVIALPLAGTVELSLFFDKSIHLLAKYEYRLHLPSRGDTLVEFQFSGYRQHDKLGWFPSGHTIQVNGTVYQRVAYTEVAVDMPETSAFFTLPEDLQQTPPGTVTEVAEGAYYVNGLGGFNLFFVEFRDFVLAVDAPARYPYLERVPPGNYSLEGNVTEDYLQKIHETVPDKPVRYLAVTHHHSDHSGGARSFLAEGATLLTTPGNRAFFEWMAAAPHTIKPDRLAQSLEPLRIETIEDKRTISDGARLVELISIGPNPHTDEMLFVYLPKENILFQGDLFYYVQGSAFPIPNREPMTKFFSDWLARSRLRPERIYSVHGYGYATWKHVERMLEWTGQ